MAPIKKTKPVVIRRRPSTFIEGENSVRARSTLDARAVIAGADLEEDLNAQDGNSDEYEDAPMSELSTDKMLLKLRMSNSRQLPVWSEAKDTLWEKGFEASAKAAEVVEAAQLRFRKILDAEAKIRDAEAARAELARLSPKADPGDEDDGEGSEERA